MAGFRIKFGAMALALEAIFILVFAFCFEYDSSADPTVNDPETWSTVMKKYPRKFDVR